MRVETAPPGTEFSTETNPILIQILALLRKARAKPHDLPKEDLESLQQALHRIRGSASFLGYLNVERLSSSLEGVVSLLAHGEIPGSLALIDGLIEATEVLQRLLEDIEYADDLDILNQVEFLHLMTNGKISDGRLKDLETRIAVTEKAVGGALCFEFSTTSFDLERAAQGGLHLYFLELDLMEDYQDKGKHLLDLVSDLTQFGLILDSGADFSTIGTLEECFVPQHMPLFVLLASRDSADRIRAFWSLSEDRLWEARNPIATRV